MVDYNRIRKVKSQREYEQLIDEYVTLGYNVKDRGELTCALEKTNFGSVTSHAIVAVVSVWWTFFIGNIVWALYNYYSKSDRVLIKLEKE